MQHYLDRKNAKLLALATQLIAQAQAEALCDEPQRPLVRRLVAEARALLDAFDDASADQEPGR